MAREEIAFIERFDPAYMHSFAMTENFIVLTEHPFRANIKVASDAFMDKPLVNGFDWRGGEKTNFIVVDRTLNRVVREIETEAVLVLHHANAFEDRGRIVIDICAYPDDEILKSLYLDRLEHNVDAPAGWLHRYTLDPAAGTGTCEKHPDVWFEMPRFNDAYAFKPYTAIYGNSKMDFHGTDFFDSLVKINPNEGTQKKWHEPGVFPGEPIFIARPGGTAEDDGVVICVVRTPAATDGHFYLLILDGHGFEEIGRAVAPPGVEIAPDFHGNFLYLDRPGRG